LHHFSGGTWTGISTPDWLAFLDISKVSATEWWAVGKRTPYEHAFLHYKEGIYTVVPAAGEDVIGVSMLPDGSGFARGVGSLLQITYETVAPDSVSIGGPTTGLVNTAHTFTATVSPITTTLPITYAWEATGQFPVTHTGGPSDLVAFTWNTTGTQTITVTATNISGTVSSTYVVTTARPYQVYLPIVIK
jgi:hypothetical protein